MINQTSSLLALPIPAAFALQGLALRRAVPQDRAFERALFETARPDASLLSEWPEDIRRAFLDQQFKFQTIHYARSHPHADRLILAMRADAIGRLILDRAGPDWALVDIALVPAWRGQGLGGALLEAVQRGAASANAGIVLSVDLSSRARRLYERLGFLPVAETFPNLAMEWRPRVQLKMA